MKACDLRARGIGMLVAVVALMFASAPRTATVVDNTLLANDSDGANWASYNRTFSEQRFSPLAH